MDVHADLPKTATGKVRKDLLVADATRIAVSLNGFSQPRVISAIELSAKGKEQPDEKQD